MREFSNITCGVDCTCIHMITYTYLLTQTPVNLRYELFSGCYKLTELTPKHSESHQGREIISYCLKAALKEVFPHLLQADPLK